MALILYCDDLTQVPQSLNTDICSISTFKWQLSIVVSVLLLVIGLHVLRKWKYRLHHTLLLYHNLRAAAALLLFSLNTIELARALLPLSAEQSQQKNTDDNNIAANMTYLVVGSDLLWNALAALSLTLILMWYHRVVEVKKSTNYLYFTCIIELFISFVRIYELAEISYFQSIYEMEACLETLSVMSLLGMAAIDGFTIYKERFRPDYLEDYEKIGYKHTLATFYSKACFWWLTPLLWFGYKEPLEVEDLGQMRLEDSARAHYDQFLLIYKTAKVKNGDRPPSLWLCYLRSSWRMFTLGGLLKLCGDLCALIGPLAIQQIVQYIESMYSTTYASWLHSNNNNNNGANNPNSTINDSPYTPGRALRSSVGNHSYDSSEIVRNRSITPGGIQNLYSDHRNNTSNSSSSSRFGNFHDSSRIRLQAAATNWISNALAAALTNTNTYSTSGSSGSGNGNGNNNYNMHYISGPSAEAAMITEPSRALSVGLSSIINTSTDDNNQMLNAGIDYNDAQVQIYYPNWLDLVSNGWAIAWLVLLAALAQGAFSQASTHVLNMTGIRIKTSLQGLIYRKTLLLNSSVGQSAAGGVVGYNEASAAGVGAGGGVDVTKGKYLKTQANGAVNIATAEEGRAGGKADVAADNAKNNGAEKAADASGLSDVGAITNLMSEDALNVMSFFWIAHYVWAIPLKIGVVMYLLYLKLGISAIIGSFVCILTMTPLQFLIGRAMSINTDKVAECADQRLRIIHDVLMGIKAIKFNVWTESFVHRIDEKRKKELKYLGWDSFYFTLMTILTHISSVLISYVTLAAYVALEGDEAEFTASRLFSALALFQQLTVPLLIFPITVPIILSAVVSTKRLERFLSAREIHKQFEGIRHMARILSKSDASLDFYEVQGKSTNDLTISESGSGDSGLGFVGDKHRVQRENKLNERLALKLHIPESPAPLAHSEPQTPLTTNDPSIVDKHLLTPRRNSEEHLLGSAVGRKLSQQRRDLLRNSPYVVIRPRKFPGGAIAQPHAQLTPAQQLAHKRMDSWSRDSLVLKLPEDMAVSVRDAAFAWNPQYPEVRLLTLRNVTVPRSKLTMVVGKNGSGKTSLLSALLMEMPLLRGDIIWNKTSTIAFVPQQPWLLNANIRENILFGESFRPRRYDFVLEACALKPDIELMPDADFTVIGERGINLSGGQRQRIAIARALYSSANVVIMDDPFSSLDNEVARHIFEQSVQRMLLKAKRTVILVTQQLQLTRHADYLIVMKNGQLLATGGYKEIELKYPHIVAKWQTIIAKVNEQTDDDERNMAAAARTACERWKLYQNVTKLGLQRTKSTKVMAAKTKTTAKVKAVAKPKTIRSDSREIVLNMEEGVVGDVRANGDTIVELLDGEVSLPANAVNDVGVVAGDSNGKELDEVDAVEEEDEDEGDDEDEEDDDDDEEEDLMTVQPLPSISRCRSGSTYVNRIGALHDTPTGAIPPRIPLTRQRSSHYGSRHLFYDAPLPTDECQMEDVILRRRRRSQRARRNSAQDQQRPYSLISTGSSRLSATSTSTTASAELRRSLFTNSVGSSAPSYMSGVSGNSLLSVDTGFAGGVEESPQRTRSWQPQSAGSDEIVTKAHQKVSRNKSSPGCLVHSAQQQQQQQQQKVNKEGAATVGLGSGFQQFLRRMSMRRTAAHIKPRPLSGTNSIRSITEETTTNQSTPVSSSVPSIELSTVATPEADEDQKDVTISEDDSWIVHIENEEVADATIDYKTLTNMTNTPLHNNDNKPPQRRNPIKRSRSGIKRSAGRGANSAATTATASISSGYDAERKYGKIPAHIYLLYLRASGWRMVTIFFLTALIWQGMRVYTDVWLQHWTDGSTGNGNINVNSRDSGDNAWKRVDSMTMAVSPQAFNRFDTTGINETAATGVRAAAALLQAAAIKTAYNNSKVYNNGGSDNGHAEDVTYYFHIYSAISCVCIVMALISTPVGQLAGCSARSNLHDQLLLAIMRKPLHFFQVTPLGRLMNRFGNDMAIIDKKIAATSQRLLQFSLLCLCAVLINVSITPWFILLTAPICIVYYGIQKFYRCSARELQRIENSTSSPVISHLSETIQGVTTIRAYNQEARFTEILFKRLEANTIAFTILNTSNRWLGISLDFLGGFIVFIAVITALVAASISCNRYKSKFSNGNYNINELLTPSPSLVGLAINYTLLMPIYLNWVVKLLADMEMYVGSVERIAYYAEIDQNVETPLDITCDDDSAKAKATGKSVNDTSVNFEVARVEYCKPRSLSVPLVMSNYESVPISWPRQGDISFENVSLRYEGQRDEVIKNLSLKIPYGQKIGICGRTGSGKSSLAMSLLGVLQTTAGRICIDDVDITKIHPDEVRMRVSMIPQDVHVFNLSIRENLNPTAYYAISELWDALEKVGLTSFVNQLPDNIDTIVGDGGVQLSAGQRQLLCLARILLRGSVCLILDEATSSLDSGAEQALLTAAHNSFRGRTIITIAHRLSTILDYDRIIVLEQGRIIEDGTPAELQQRKDGAFYGLLHSGHTVAGTACL
ncbi:LOW QUALITY PROTEIN: ATP-binding cassette sub-family C member Sur [Bactrocera neohumeralis]|uniref:LOW QUALITY PROTEIN: ATP-binding cassette sub-family C member Sur n=1 Tax=Bactrocera neohumeralis TaxID=98809 RepID=UPI002165B689|nr:LOW QUALITY PROTEIN: ATP-binding cassette sub-family C member Sur [Bactrocera neohumeralis]